MKKYFYELMTDVRGDKWPDKAVQGVLKMLSLAYGIIVMMTRDLYKEHILPVYRSPKPVVSVGNITMGGVGKTPFVIWLARALMAKGLKPVVLSRGYASSSDGLNDEARMFQEVLPGVLMVTGKDRRKSIQQALLKQDVDVFIADDAFSHWPLHRDLDIVAIDAANPFGNGYLVPRGILREQVENLVRADVFVLTKIDKSPHTRLLFDRLRKINSRALIMESKHQPKNFRNVLTGGIDDLSTFKNQKVVAFCAIGDPSSFEFTLKQTGLNLVHHFTFVDHYHYQAQDLEEVAGFAKQENIKLVVTTHKDAVKITGFGKVFDGLTVVCLDIDLEITQGQNEIIKRIISLRCN
jgi:tetraacyldisaccharide 4'-kinase